jgi:hypothetical protein
MVLDNIFNFFKLLMSGIALFLLIPQTIIEKVTIEIVLYPFAKAAYSGGTCRKKINIAGNSQITGQAITQKSADLFRKVSFRTFINVADVWFTFWLPLIFLLLLLLFYL